VERRRLREEQRLTLLQQRLGRQHLLLKELHLQESLLLQQLQEEENLRHPLLVTHLPLPEELSPRQEANQAALRLFSQQEEQRQRLGRLTQPPTSRDSEN
jgi:hypothetical protein